MADQWQSPDVHRAALQLKPLPFISAVSWSFITHTALLACLDPTVSPQALGLGSSVCTLWNRRHALEQASIFSTS